MTFQTTHSARSAPWARYGLWTLKGLLALVFLAAAFLKLSGNKAMVLHFGEVGLGQWFRYLTGGVEVLGAVLLLWPRLSLSGVFILFCVCVGALAAQLGPLHGDIIHVVVLGGLLALTAWGVRSDERSRRR